QLNVLEAIRRHDTKIRMHIADSSEEYGLVHPDEVPMKETNPLRPLSPYAVSKVAQDKLAYQYFKSYGLHLVTTRGFNHTGPRRGTHFVTSTIARQIAMVLVTKCVPRRGPVWLKPLVVTRCRPYDLKYWYASLSCATLLTA